MSKSIRKITLILITFALIFTMLGCNEKKLTVQEINTIVSDTISSSEEVSALQFDIDLSMSVDVTGGQNPTNMDISATIAGAIDNTNEKMHATINATADVPGTKQEIEMEYYIIDGWSYTKMGTLWNKEQIEMDQWTNQNQIFQQLESLKSTIDFTSIGSEKVNGVACYIFQLSPDMEEIFNWISQQGGNLDELNLDNINLDQIFKDTSIKIWIAKDSSLLMKVELDAYIDISPEDVGANTDDFENITMDLTLSMNFHDYNESVTITLPAEAASAS